MIQATESTEINKESWFQFHVVMARVMATTGFNFGRGIHARQTRLY